MRQFTLPLMMGFVLLGITACNPDGPRTCSSDADCASNAYCGAAGLCVQRASPDIPDGSYEGDDGGQDGGDDGGTDGGTEDAGGHHPDPDGGEDAGDGGADAGVTCSPTCESWEQCQAGTCTALYASLSWAGPAPGTFVTSQGVLLSVDLALAPGAVERADPPSILFQATHSSGHAMTGHLSRVSPGSYEGSFVPDRGGSWTVVADWAEAGLSTAELRLEADCNPSCSSHEECMAGTCGPLYAGLTWTSPTPGAAVSAQGIQVELELALATGATQRNDPPTIAFAATHATAPTVEGQLSRVGPGSYQGTFVPTHGGSWEVGAHWPAAGLSADPLPLMADCIPGCPSHEWCQAGACLPRYSSVAVVSPTNGRKLDGGTHSIAAELRLAPGASRNDPAELAFTVGQPDGGMGTGQLQLAGAGYYTGTWSPPPGDGTFHLTARYPAAGLTSSAVGVTVDRQPPTFSVTVPARSPKPNAGNFVFEEAGNYFNAWKRNETVRLVVESPDSDLVGNSVTLSASFDGGTPRPFPVTPVSPCQSAYCGAANVELDLITFTAFNGELSVEVRGTDDVGNVGVDRSSTLPVTRFKWSYQNDPVTSDIVVGSGGALYFGTNGGVRRVDPDGSVAWARPAGPLRNLALSASSPTGELLCVAERTATTTLLWCANAATGAVQNTKNVNSEVYGRGALVRPAGLSVDCYVVSSLSTLHAFCPHDLLEQSLPTAGGSIGVVAQGDLVMVAGDSASRVDGYRLSSTGFTPVFGFPKTPTSWPSGFAISSGGALLVPTGNGVQSFSLSSSGAAPSQTYGQNSVGPSVVTDNGGRLLFVQEASLTRVPLAGFQTPGVWTAPQRIRGAVVGSRGGIHVTTYDNPTGSGTFWFLDEGLNPRWGYPVGSTRPAVLDCNRQPNGAPIVDRSGVAYVVGENLYAFIIDDAGLNQSADWPRPGRDAQGSNNALGPPVGCP